MLEKILAQHHSSYKELLTSFRRYFAVLKEVKAVSSADADEPTYINGFLPGLDCVALYCLLAQSKPQLYLEIGSGNSTKFARRSILDNALRTKIISIDPQPRAEVDELCDETVRQPLEDVDLALFDRLGAGDILFVDNSHRCFMNSDVTVCFLEVLPRLRQGVLVQIHDIYLPFDYPAEWKDRYYNEQYLLGALLANGLPSYEIVLPCYYVSSRPELTALVEPLWAGQAKFRNVERHGGSFWMRRI